ncbi:MAG: histidine phosphatase family protein [Planctomycetota bacterium]|nr:histidine phosphatase family protein [Planctomycetota bacterium]
MKLYIVRHADPDYDKNTITPAGHQEAQALARRLAAEGLDRIYCSPVARARDTMRHTAELAELTPVIEDWTQEPWDWRGTQPPWGELLIWDLPCEIIRRNEPMPTAENWHQLPDLQDPLARGKFEAVQKNSDAFIARHGYERDGGRYRVVRPNRERIAVFCHGGFGLTWVAHLLAIPLTLMWSSFWLAPTSVTTVLFDERSSDWAVPRCLGLGDVSHLYESRLPVRPRGILANYV